MQLELERRSVTNLVNYDEEDPVYERIDKKIKNN